MPHVYAGNIDSGDIDGGSNEDADKVAHKRRTWKMQDAREKEIQESL